MQRVNAQKACRRFPDGIARIDFMPAGGQCSKSRKGDADRLLAKRAVTFKPRHGGNAFDLGTPPDKHNRVFGGTRLQAPRRCLGDKQRHDRGGVPKFHRLSRRSAMSAATAETLLLGRGGWSPNSARAGGTRLSRTTPSRMSRDSRPSSSGACLLITGSSRATGRPRSTIRTGEPPLRLSMSALSRFLASMMLAFFIWLK
jgi:hypothetical protein